MSMSTTVVGFIPPDEQWEKMKAIYLNCKSAGVSVPKEVEDFFDEADPENDPGREIELGKALTEWQSEDGEGYEVEIAKLPKNVKIVRFFNSW